MQTRQRFALEIDAIRRHTLKLGASVEQALRKALRALVEHNEALADTVVREDGRVDTMCSTIQSLCTRAIASHQPVAGDLRELIATMQVAAELERIGDHARHVAEAVVVVSDRDLLSRVGKLEQMADSAICMLRDAITAYVDMDTEAAEQVMRADEELDRLHWSTHHDLLTLMQQNPERVDQGTSLMFLNRFLERLGDHATTICRWILFARRGIRAPMRLDG
jgi:phosphate transport system protein